MNLLLEPQSRQVYQYCKQNQAIVLGLKDFITQETVDQLPPLVDLQRYLEQLRLMNPPDTLPSSIGIQPISEIATEITENQDYHKIADTHKKVFASMDEEGFAKRLSKLYELDELNDLLDDPKCGKCGSIATQRCSLCKLEWYCGRPCQVKAWTMHKSICELTRAAK
jgi:zinc finger MYND domain-containing protein 10